MNIEERSNPVAGKPRSGTDEIELMQVFLVLWDCRAWIIGCTAAFVLMGGLYAFFATPQYYSQATIALKETGKGNAPGIFSQLGGVGGMVASQLGMGNTNIPKMEVILKSTELAESVIVKNRLLPVIFHKSWDPERNAWKIKNPKKIPTSLHGAEALKGGILQVSVEDKKGIIRIGARTYDPKIAKIIVDGYLLEMNNRIRLNVMNDADSNRRYLERQLTNTSDPILIEKIQDLIAGEIGNSMLMSSRAFEVLESPIVPLKKAYPKKSLILVLSFLVGIGFSLAGIFLWKAVGAFKKALSASRQPRERASGLRSSNP